jgi:anthranilate phosphoribosyltransferase
MIKEAISKIVEKNNLSVSESEEVMNEIMEGKATSAQISAFITALRMKGEAIEEITGMAKSMRKHATTIKPKAKLIVDTCGTGGDKANTFNVSTISAIVASSAGVTIAKHGNRAVSSKCGSIDLLEALGVKTDLPPEAVKQCIDEIGIGFMFAPLFHEAMKHAMPTRQEIGIRTVFNILGPLTNPANATAQVLGVFHPNLTEIMAKVLNNLGTKRAFVVHGLDGIDEISVGNRTKVSSLHDNRIENYYLDPKYFGMAKRPVKIDSLAGGTSKENAKITIEILKNIEDGPKRDIVILNSAAAIVVGEKAQDLKSGVELANEMVASGKAFEKLEDIKKFTSKFK